MSEVIHRLDVIVGEHFKIKTNVGDIEKEIELQSDKIVVVSDLLVKVQKQTTEFHQKTSFGKYIMYLKNTKIKFNHHTVGKNQSKCHNPCF